MKQINIVFEEQFAKMLSRNWDCIYVVVDMHDTVFKSTYANDEELQPFKNSVEVLQMLTKRKDVKLIYWSSSMSNEIIRHLDYLKKRGVHFSCINANTFEKSTSYANFERKFYMNVILDDKAGFDPSEDWDILLNYLNKIK